MKKTILFAVILFVQMSFFGLPKIAAQEREIAVTIDDLPLNGQQFNAPRLRIMTEKFLAGIKKFQIPVVGFVNESLLYQTGETDARIEILKSWSESGVELGNHTFSHLGFKDATLNDYEDDFVRGEAVTKMILKSKGAKIRYFRHPFLQMGATLETEKAFENFIAQRGYKIAPVTIDTMDWMFLAAYGKARAEGDRAKLKEVSDDYLKFAAAKFDFCDKVSRDLFGRSIRHILLLHANELNADNFDALINLIKEKRFRFITLDQALQDAAYRFPEKYIATSDWLGLWAFDKGKQFVAPQPPEYVQKIYNGK